MQLNCTGHERVTVPTQQPDFTPVLAQYATSDNVCYVSFPFKKRSGIQGFPETTVETDIRSTDVPSPIFSLLLRKE